MKRTPLHRRTPLGPGAKSLERGSTFGPGERTHKPRQPVRSLYERAWGPFGRSRGNTSWSAAARSQRCACCPAPATAGHHVIYQQHLKSHGLQAFLWDLRNQLPLCERCHARHHAAFARIPRGRLLADNFRFADELGLLWLLEREYPDVQPPEET